MVYVDAQCEGGGTEFPRIRMPETWKGNWCKFLECNINEEKEVKGGKQSMGITFKPIRRNAVFWENIRSDGHGYQETWHAGLPVLAGWKVGLNIWSWGTGREQ